MMRSQQTRPQTQSRRSFLQNMSVLGGAAALGSCSGRAAGGQESATGDTRADTPPEDYRIEHGRIRLSVYSWCFQPMPEEQLIRACHRMGVTGMDVDVQSFPLLRELGMHVTMVSSHGFQRGPCSREHHAFVVEQLRKSIDIAVQWGSPHVITFTGMREPGVTDEQGKRNCVDCWKAVIGYAEEKGINLCLEILNTRDDTHPMKGHPGYFGDDVELCIDLIKRVDSPRMKLLFDVYHVQVMNGDIVRRIREYHPYIGHYHVAGAPGRNEPDDTQEINYSAVLRAILATGYDGLVSLEFIPTWDDKLAALRHAVRICDV